jgi:hypothetical protein
MNQIMVGVERRLVYSVMYETCLLSPPLQRIRWSIFLYDDYRTTISGVVYDNLDLDAGE